MSASRPRPTPPRRPLTAHGASLSGCMKLRVTHDAGGSPTWRLIGSGGEEIAAPLDTYPTLAAARRGALAFRATVSAAHFEVGGDGSAFRWSIYRGFEDVVVSRQVFGSRETATEATRLIREHAVHAATP